MKLIRAPLIRLRRLRAGWQLRRQIAAVESWLSAGERERQLDAARPVLFFNASTRIDRLSINGAFGMLAAWSLRGVGTPVRYAVCESGMLQCILGTDREDYSAPPPCQPCIAFSRVIYPEHLTHWIELDLEVASEVQQQLKGLSMAQLEAWTWRDLPLGSLSLPGLRWALRRHHLPDDRPTRGLYRRFIASAASLACAFEQLIDNLQPQSLVIFNGVFYPEAVARHVAEGRGLRVFSHEVGLREHSAFFTASEATFREIELPDEFALDPSQEARLETYLAKRIVGDFKMAGVKFWPEMGELPPWLTERMSRFDQVIPVFTNVVFDTSQLHANVVFNDMFDWLDSLIETIEKHAETLFILRSHPDEERPGKASRQSVAEWVERTGLAHRENVVFFSPSDYVSSYELIHHAKLALVYNSSIGLEAAIMGKPVLCAGRARYSQIPTVFFPESRKAYLNMLEQLLSRERIQQPPQFVRNARRFLYHELFHASLDLSEFLEPYPWAPGMVTFTRFHQERLTRAESLRVIREGILEAGRFVLEEAIRDQRQLDYGRVK